MSSFRQSGQGLGKTRRRDEDNSTFTQIRFWFQRRWMRSPICVACTALRICYYQFKLLYVILVSVFFQLRHWQLSYLQTNPGQTETKEAYIKHPKCPGPLDCFNTFCSYIFCLLDWCVFLCVSAVQNAVQNLYRSAAVFSRLFTRSASNRIHETMGHLQHL